MPFGISCAPYLFTKLLKPVLGAWKAVGRKSVCYLDDCYLQGSTAEECLANVHRTCELLECLGFTINRVKSSLIPKPTASFLGFIVNSVDMTISLPKDKKKHIISLCAVLGKGEKRVIRDVAKAIGTVVASFSAVEMGPLHYRTLERENAVAVCQNKPLKGKSLWLYARTNP